MASKGWIVAILCVFCLGTAVQANPIIWLRDWGVSPPSDRGWLWGWVWGAESQVSVVDRAPPMNFASRPAAFGPELTTPLLGYVIPLSSFTHSCKTNKSLLDENNGCPSLCVSGPHSPDKDETWIALVQRGKCQFSQKVREAQMLGANAVVVGGDDPESTGHPDGLVNMFSNEDTSDISIPSTFIRYSDYAMLSSLIAHSNTSHSGLRTLSLLINSEYSTWDWYTPILTFIIILLLPSTLTMLTLIVHRIRAARAARRERAPEDIVKSLPWFVRTGSGWEKHEGIPPGLQAPSEDLEAGAVDGPSVSRGHGETSSRISQVLETLPWFDSQVECAICLGEFAPGDKVRVLPCCHIFHMDEVDEWLIQRKKLCPICKADVTHPYHARPRPAKRDAKEDEEGDLDPGPSATDPSSATPEPANERTPLLANQDASPS